MSFGVRKNEGFPSVVEKLSGGSDSFFNEESGCQTLKQRTVVKRSYLTPNVARSYFAGAFGVLRCVPSRPGCRSAARLHCIQSRNMPCGAVTAAVLINSSVY